MRKASAVAACAGLLATSLVAGTLLPASSQQAPTESFATCDKDKVIFEKEINERKKRFGAGDWGVFTQPQFDPQTGDKVGRVVGRFVFVKKTSPRDGYYIADVTLNLPKGKLMAYGSSKLSNFEKGARFAITGGTGSYARARGTVSVRIAKCNGARGTRTTYSIVKA
jgi:hypothetical protein